MDTYEKVKAGVKIVLAVLFLAALAACQEDVTLLGEDGAVIGKGTLTLNAGSPASVNFVLNGKAYAGSWRVSNAYDPDDEKRYKLMGSRSYENYLMGNEPDQLRQAHAELLAQDDGTSMTCDFRYRRRPKEGSCSGGEEKLRLIMHHG